MHLALIRLFANTIADNRHWQNLRGDSYVCPIWPGTPPRVVLNLPPLATLAKRLDLAEVTQNDVTSSDLADFRSFRVEGIEV
jgi:hypothetical protein